MSIRIDLTPEQLRAVLAVVAEQLSGANVTNEGDSLRHARRTLDLALMEYESTGAARPTPLMFRWEDALMAAISSCETTGHIEAAVIMRDALRRLRGPGDTSRDPVDNIQVDEIVRQLEGVADELVASRRAGEASEEHEAEQRATCSVCLARRYRGEECLCNDGGDAEDYYEALEDLGLTVECAGCGRNVQRSTARVHENNWIGSDCCWDESTRSAE